MVLNRIKHNKGKFLTTMILIIISATVINYAIYSLLDIYFDTVKSIYSSVHLNMVFTVVVIGIVTVVMMVLLPKESINELYIQLENDHGTIKRFKTPDQELRDMVDDDNDDVKDFQK